MAEREASWWYDWQRKYDRITYDLGKGMFHKRERLQTGNIVSQKKSVSSKH